MLSNTPTYDQTPWHRPGIDELGGAVMANVTVPRDPRTVPDARAFTQLTQQIVAAAKLTPSVRLQVNFVGGNPVVTSATGLSSALVAADFDLVHNGPGDTTITIASWLGEDIRPYELTIAEDIEIDRARVFPVAKGWRIKTKLGSVGTDAAFVLALHAPASHPAPPVGGNGWIVNAGGAFLLNASGAQLVTDAAALSCLTVTPVPGALALQGRLLSVSGTVSRASTTVMLTIGATSVPAVMAGLTWSYSRLLVVGDIGSLTISASATDVSTGDTANARPVTITVQAVVDKTLFTSGIYVPALTGNQGDVLGVIPSTVGVNALTPSATAPKLSLNAVRGKPAAFYRNSGSPYQYLSTDVLAQYLRSATSTWSCPIQIRVDKSGGQPIWTALKSSGASDEQFFFRTLGTQFAIARKTASGALQTLTATVSRAPFDDLMLLLVCNAGVYTLYERPYDADTEVVSVLGSFTDTAALSSGVDRFTWGASVSSIPFEIVTAYQSAFAFAPGTAFTAGDVKLLFDEWRYDSPFGLAAASLEAIPPGDSIMMEVQDVPVGMGTRNPLFEFFGQNGINLTVRGGTEAGGAGRYGTGRYSQTSANSGQTIDQISAQALVDIAASPGKVRYWHCYMGGGDNNFLVAPSTMTADFVAKFTQVMNTLIAQDSHAFVSVSPLIPNQTTSIQANLVAWRGQWPASIIAVLQTLFPGRVYAADWFLATGGVWSATYWDADPGHMNRLGSVTCVLDPVNGTLAAKNELNETLAQRILRESPNTPSRLPLSCAITSPAPAASIAHGTTINFAIDVSRIGGKPQLVVDGVNKGNCTPIDIYDFTLVSGSYVKDPHITWSYALATGVPDVGAHSAYIRYTDADGVTVVNSPTVAYTVT